LPEIDSKHEQRLEADQLRRNARPEQMRVQAFEFRHDDPHILSAGGNLNPSDLLQGHAKGHGMHIGTDAAHALHESNGLGDVLALGQPLDAAEVEADFQRSADDMFALAVQLNLVGLLKSEVIGTNGNAIAHGRPASGDSIIPGASSSRSISEVVERRPSKGTA
jgi:hypothetical protein